jgi:2-hydroxy-6-oxonona-2,4-dienedioate hydrolase
MAQIKVPALVFWTDHNPIHGTDAAKRMAELMNADYYCMEGAGHWPQWEKPEEHDRIITEFMLKPVTVQK